MSNSSTLICNKPDCFLAQTDRCILSNEPKTCPDRLESLNNTGQVISQATGEPVLSTPVDIERFTGSFTLSPTQVEKIMHQRYCHVVGILGTPGAGKTACLVSFYLLLAHANLDGFEFRDSKSLMAFEEISRGARRWDAANYPDQLTLHTEIADERTAGFLHVKIKGNNMKNAIDLLLPDLPGEWSTSLIDANRIDRLKFLKSADRIWLMVNGQEIAEMQTRNYTIHRLSLLIERVSNLLDGPRPPLTLVVSRKDRFESNDLYYEKLQEKATIHGFSFKVIEIASFSEDDDIAAGDGIVSLISDLITKRGDSPHEFWPATNNRTASRQMLNFGKSTT